jgi:hypothetical protein
MSNDKIEHYLQAPLPDGPRAEGNGIHTYLVHQLALGDVGKDYSEDECFVADAVHQFGFETLDDDATVYGCTLGQLVELMRAYGVTIAKPGEPRLCQHGVEIIQGKRCDECQEEYRQMRSDDQRGYENRG